jgi:enoyl-CoA hydratase/carnithine racemase
VTNDVEVHRSGATVEIHLNRPDKRNAITGAMYTAVSSALADAEADTDVRAVVIAGRGAGFCAGNDLKDFVTNPPEGKDSPPAVFLNTIAGLTVPVVAAVQGNAVGVGATMLLHCDYVVADPTARIHFAFVPLGVVPEAGSTLLLPRLVGHLASARLLMLAEPVGAEEAARLGLVSEVSPAGEHVAAARRAADRFAAQPATAVRLTKQLLRDDPALPERMRAEARIFRRQLAGPEFASAVGAFAARRDRP